MTLRVEFVNGFFNAIGAAAHYDNDFVSNIERFLERNALEDTQPYTDEEIEVALQC